MADDPPAGEHAKRTNLGRGLAALFGEEGEDYGAPDTSAASRAAPIEQLHPNRYQPRQAFDEDALRALADSIAANGILQPILVRRHPDRPGEFEIIAGERRWRAAQMARLHEVPVVVRDLDDSQALEAALVENVQRQDLSPVEEAEGYQRLVDEFAHTQEDLARVVGKSRSHIANTLRLLNLPAPVKDMLGRGELSAGHGRALLGAADPAALAAKVVKRGLNVRQTEHLVQQDRGRAPGAGRAARPARPGTGEKDADTLALERDLTALLGLKVAIEFDGHGGGALTIRYRTLEQLDDVLRRLNQTPADLPE